MDDDTSSRQPDLYLEEVAGMGLGVFTDTFIPAGRQVLIFSGPRFTLEQVEVEEISDEEHCIQVSADEYLGPSGDLDDFVNHSCDPNCGLRLRDNTLQLVAIKDIQPGEQLFFDYSTSTNQGKKWRMDCCCGASRCRGVAYGFSALPKDVREYYLALGVVPAFVLVPRTATQSRYEPDLVLSA